MGASSSKSSKKSSSSKAQAASAGITDVDRAILSLKTQRNKLTEQQRLLDARIDRHQEVAKQLLREGRKDRALLALKKKKLTENQLTQLSTHMMNVEGMLSNIETSKQQAKLVEVLQKGNEALKNLQNLVSIDDVKKLMDDTAEAKAYQDELNQMLGQSLSDADDEAVAAEMELLEDAERLDEKAMLPNVPQTKPVQIKERSTGIAQTARQEEEEEEEEPAEARRLEPMLAS